MDKAEGIRKQLKDLCSRFGVEILYGFGSRAKEVKGFLAGEGTISPHSKSDVDIAAKLRPKTLLSIRDKVRLGTALEDLMGVGRVDLCMLHEADPFLAANAVRGERLFCKDEVLGDEYELYVLRRAGDLAYLEHQRLDLIFKGDSAKK